MGKKIKCNFCEATTTQGVGESSGFGHAKMTIGKGKNKRSIDIYSCSEHGDLVYPEIENFVQG